MARGAVGRLPYTVLTVHLRLDVAHVACSCWEAGCRRPLRFRHLQSRLRAFEVGCADALHVLQKKLWLVQERIVACIRNGDELLVCRRNGGARLSQACHGAHCTVRARPVAVAVDERDRYLDVVQVVLQRRTGPSEGPQKVPQCVLPAAAGRHDVVEVVLERIGLIVRQPHGLLEPALDVATYEATPPWASAADYCSRRHTPLEGLVKHAEEGSGQAPRVTEYFRRLPVLRLPRDASRAHQHKMLYVLRIFESVACRDQTAHAVTHQNHLVDAHGGAPGRQGLQEERFGVLTIASPPGRPT
mmetsp:Transcript_19182/g.57903  ORF Transcript_19182/g.57903 Transcript_19182/m.57903 type:complete len:301 (-) Transcript_19182:646-1548(-)